MTLCLTLRDDQIWPLCRSLREISSDRGLQKFSKASLKYTRGISMTRNHITRPSWGVNLLYLPRVGKIRWKLCTFSYQTASVSTILTMDKRYVINSIFSEMHSRQWRGLSPSLGVHLVQSHSHRAKFYTISTFQGIIRVYIK